MKLAYVKAVLEKHTKSKIIDAAGEVGEILKK